MQPSPMRVYAIAALIAICCGVFSALFVFRFERVGIRNAVHQMRASPISAKKPVAAWVDMTQEEVDALTADLKKMRPREVAIFCATRECDDLALDFDNAFESARWISGIERPLADTNVGINVAPKGNADAVALRDAIERATGGRLKPGLIDAAIGDRLAVIISKNR